MKNKSFFSASFSTATRVSMIALAILVMGSPFLARADIINRQLEITMSGTDVSAMQTFFAKDLTIYPQGLVTGYFGFLTKSAVSNFQSRNGISPVGRVGPITLPILNAQMAGGTSGLAPGMGDGGSAALILNVLPVVSNTSVVMNWSTNELAKGLVYYSTSPLTEVEHENSVDVSGLTAMTDMNFRTIQNVSITGLQPNTTYYYLIYVTDAATNGGNVSVTVPGTFHTNN